MSEGNRILLITGFRTMKNQRLLVVLTVINLGLLTFHVIRPRLAFAQGAAPALRGSALEIVDDQGRLRAAIKVLPVDPAQKMPNGQPYPETVILRLIDPNGRPKGALNKSGKELRELISNFLVENFEEVQSSFANLEPKEKIKVYCDLLVFAVPRLRPAPNNPWDGLTEKELIELYAKLKLTAHETIKKGP